MTATELLEYDREIGDELSTYDFADSKRTAARELLDERKAVRAELEFRHVIAAAELYLPDSTSNKLTEVAR